jgi:hypothetical protein
LFSCWSGEFTVSLSPPKLEEFHLEYGCESSRVTSGEKWHLCKLKMATEWRSRRGLRPAPKYPCPRPDPHNNQLQGSFLLLHNYISCSRCHISSPLSACLGISGMNGNEGY